MGRRLNDINERLNAMEVRTGILARRISELEDPPPDAPSEPHYDHPEPGWWASDAAVKCRFELRPAGPKSWPHLATRLQLVWLALADAIIEDYEACHRDHDLLMQAAVVQARSEAFEEAAKIADSYASLAHTGQTVPWKISDAIRSRKEKT